MAIEKYNIGGTLQETEAFEAFADIPQNRVLLAEKLTVNSPAKPEIVEGLTNVEQVFKKFQPNVQIDFETEQGTIRKEDLLFQNLGDFGIKGITSQSNFLNELTLKKDQFQKIIRQLKTNKPLQQVLSDRETKQNLLIALDALIKELKET
jgi:hypothetical protein